VSIRSGIRRRGADGWPLLGENGAVPKNGPRSVEQFAAAPSPDISHAVAANFTTFYVVKFALGGPRPALNRNPAGAGLRLQARWPFARRVKFPGWWTNLGSVRPAAAAGESLCASGAPQNREGILVDAR